MKHVIVLLAAFIAIQASVAAQDSIPALPSKPEAKAKGKGSRDADVAEWEKLRSNTNNVVLDVRTEAEFASGHIPGAVHIDIRSKDFAETVGKLDKSKTYLVHCASGARSAKACKQMQNQGFKETVNLLGGIVAWEEAGNKSVKDK
jgi:phage shock protein E